MTDLVEIADRQPNDLISTHWEGCEEDHPDCLIQRMADEIRRLRAENERLREDNVTLRKDAWRMQEHSRDAVATLCAENKALRRDAERWRWLRKNSSWTPSERPPALASVSKRIWYHATDNEIANDLDDLADAAMGREQEGGE